MIFYGVLTALAVAAGIVVVPVVVIVMIERLERMAPAPEFFDDRGRRAPRGSSARAFPRTVRPRCRL